MEAEYSCIRLPLYSTLHWTPLPIPNNSYCQIYSGLLPSSDNACRVHKQNPMESLLHFCIFLLLMLALFTFYLLQLAIAIDEKFVSSHHTVTHIQTVPNRP